MTQTDHVNDIAFSTAFGIDKIILDDGSASYAVSSGTPVTPTSSTQTATNTTGVAAMPNGMFSIDGANFYPMGSRVDGAKDGGTMQRQYAECWMTCSASTLTFYLRNGFTSGKTFTIRYTLESLS